MGLINTNKRLRELLSEYGKKDTGKASPDTVTKEELVSMLKKAESYKALREMILNK